MSNNTLLEAFIKNYSINGQGFTGDIPCIAYVLNLVIQDILKAIIKDNYISIEAIDALNRENDFQGIYEEENINISKF